MVLIVVGYKKAFDSIDQTEMLKTLADCGKDYNIIVSLNTYKKTTAHVKPYENTSRFWTDRGVRLLYLPSCSPYCSSTCSRVEWVLTLMAKC